MKFSFIFFSFYFSRVGAEVITDADEIADSGIFILSGARVER